MSESTQFTDITTTDHKLMPPRSLHGIDDAEAIWNTITRRFPNAAPLFHEMETVIERAEDLLQQFKAPCTQDIGIYCSYHKMHMYRIYKDFIYYVHVDKCDMR